RSGDPLYGIRRLLLTRSDLLTDKQTIRLQAALAAEDAHVAVEVVHQIYQELIDAYEHQDRRAGKIMMFKLLKRIHTDVPSGLRELAQLGRSLWKRRHEPGAFTGHDQTHG